MSLLLDRNEEGRYELKHCGVVISRFDVLSHAMNRSVQYAKNHAQKIYVSKACISDWYVGFPKDKNQNPLVFQSFEPVEAGLENSEFRFLEGPFESQEVAKYAAFKISGKMV
jgi:hypothetical protein